MYQQEDTEFHRRDKNIHMLTKWVGATVSKDYLKNCCPPTESLREWYAKLKMRAEPTEVNKTKRLVLRHSKALAPLSRPPKSYHDWLVEWENVMTEAAAKGYQFATDPTQWGPHFTNAIKNVKPKWADYFEVRFQPMAEEGTLTVKKVASYYTQKAVEESMITKRVTKGQSFGPTYNG